jgi:hypothetical protein
VGLLADQEQSEPNGPMQGDGDLSKKNRWMWLNFRHQPSTAGRVVRKPCEINDFFQRHGL